MFRPDPDKLEHKEDIEDRFLVTAKMANLFQPYIIFYSEENALFSKRIGTCSKIIWKILNKCEKKSMFAGKWCRLWRQNGRSRSKFTRRNRRFKQFTRNTPKTMRFPQHCVFSRCCTWLMRTSLLFKKLIPAISIFVDL